MRYRICQRGSAAIEMAALLPIMAAFLLIAVQIFRAGSAAITGLSRIDAAVSAALAASMSPDAFPHEWPCLEDVDLGDGGRVGAADETVVIGMGATSLPVRLRQEVWFVTEPICRD